MNAMLRRVLMAASPKWLAILFACQAGLAILLLSILVPPFENSDEFNHFERADQVSRLGLVATRFGGPPTSGGMTDLGIPRVDTIIGVVRFHPERKVDAAMLRDANAIGWHESARLSFPNTAIYTPFLYLPSVPAIWAGKIAHLSIVRTMILARASNGMFCVVLASLAIAAAGEAALLLAMLLSMPMCLSLFASVSQDGPMLAAAATSVALVRLIRDRPDPVKRRAFVALCIALLMLGLGRPSYVPFAVLPLLMPGLSRRARASGSLFIIAGIGAWSLLTMLVTMTNGSSDRGVAPGAQLLALIEHPARILPLAWNTFAGRQGMEGEPYLHEIIGVLGWIDTRMPTWFYELSIVVLLLACALTVTLGRPLLRPAAQGITALAAMAAAGLVFLLLYLTWSPLGFPFVDGVQGRYFLPILLLLPLFLPAVGAVRLLRSLAPVRSLLLLYPALSVVVTIVTVVRRYYV